ncbi:hypothetical protein JVU11DRAFT_7785 [Chiua virens]|nr:hypothetical protein JVU11DRAFT_7785 [Chiua virens]
MSGEPERGCDACHLIPHSKGDEYMRNLSRYRGDMYGSGVGPLDSVNDTRNGLLLAISFHRPLDRGDIAFLKTPNFALGVDDVQYYHPRNADSPSPENRLTVQYIQPTASESVMLPLFGPHNSDARQPEDLDQWPPAIIVDLCYAAAILQEFGPSTFRSHIQDIADDHYYGRDMGGGDAGGNDGEDASRDWIPQRPSSARIVQCNLRSATSKAQAGTSSDRRTRAAMFDGIMALWLRAARQGKGRQHEGDVADNKNKVQTWLQSVEESDDSM